MVALSTTVIDEKSQQRINHKLKDRVIKNFLDVIILNTVQKANVSGYDIILAINQKYNLLVSSGTIYSTLYTLERKGLVKASWEQRKRIYSITDKGLIALEGILNGYEVVKSLITDIMGYSQNGNTS